MKTLIKKFIDWLLPSLQGNNGTSSSRRLTAFWFVILATITCFSIIVLAYLMVLLETKIEQIDIETLEVLTDLFIYITITVLTLFGIVTVQNISQMLTFKFGKNEPSDKAEN